jgi:arylsulfatase A
MVNKKLNNIIIKTMNTYCLVTRVTIKNKFKHNLRLYTLTFALLIFGFSLAQAQKKNQKPNIVFILADDLGYSELGSYGNTFNETPNLDKLAKDGVRFTQAYASAPVCSPYRAALMTGLYPARIGITDYLRPAASNHLDLNYTTLPEQLQKIGYHTGIIGKWHLSGYKMNGASEETLPDKHGFDEVISSEITGIGNVTYYYPYHFNPKLEKKSKADKEYIIDRMNEEATDFIKRNKDKPFFLYLSHYAVHTMLHGKKELVEKYRNKPGAGKSNPSDNNPDDDFYEKWPSDYFAKQNNPHLASQLETIDEGVGMIRNQLEKLGLAENTLIIFTSDNGGESRVTDNAPLRGGKSELYEGGIREPLLAYMPGLTPSNRVINTPMSNYDFYPTLCEFTGIDKKNYANVDGISILSSIKGIEPTVESKRAFYWHYPLKKEHFLGGRSAGAIRLGDWKLIEFFDTSERELYNLKSDLGEKHNLYFENFKKADSLQKLLINWRKEVSAKYE